MEALGYTASIAPELTALARPLADAKLHPKNIRKHRLEKIAQSLTTHGQRAPIIVQSSTGYIVKGNGTWEAAKMLGWDRIAMSVQDMNDTMALGFLYADNRASDLASYDRKKLRDGLAAMIEGPGLLDTLWEIDEFEDLDEEFRGVTTLATLPVSESDPVIEGGSPVEATAPDPRKKMREVPMVFTAEEHAMFTGWLTVLCGAFQVTQRQGAIYEAVRRQAIVENGGAQITGRIPEKQVPGQTAMEDIIPIGADSDAVADIVDAVEVTSERLAEAGAANRARSEGRDWSQSSSAPEKPTEYVIQTGPAAGDVVPVPTAADFDF